LRVKQDAIPGMVIPIHFVPTKHLRRNARGRAFTLAVPTAKDPIPYVHGGIQAADGPVLVKPESLISRRAGKTRALPAVSSVHIGLITGGRSLARNFAG